MCPPYLIDQCQNMYNSQVMIRFVPPQISLSTCYLPTRVCGDLCVRQFLRAAPSRGGLQCTFSCLFLGRFGIMIPKLLLLLYTPLIPPLFLQLICRAGLPTISTRYDTRQRDKILKRLCHTQIPKTLYFLK